jgi:hypothetical protein
MTLVEMRERINIVATEMGAIATKENRTAEDESRVDALLAEFNELGPKIQREQKIADAVAEGDKMNQSRGRQVPGAGQPKDGAQPTEERDTRSWSRRFVESDPMKNHGPATPFEVGSFYHRSAPTVQHTADMSPQELRTLVYTGAFSADMIRPQLVPGFFRGEDLVGGSLRDVLINGQTDSDALIFFREAAFTNNAAGVAEATATSGASGLKPESALTYEQATAPVVTIAHWIPVTRQALQDFAQIQTLIEQRLLDGLRLEESDQLLNGNGTPDLTGLLNTGSVQALDNTYWTSNPVPDEGSGNENFNRILMARVAIRITGRARANFAVMHPTDLAKFLMYTDGNQNYIAGGPFSGSGVANLWGLRLVEDENIAAGTALVGDGRMAAVWDRMQAQIFIDTIDDQFVRNMLTILAEERLALTVFRPQAFAKVTLVS